MERRSNEEGRFLLCVVMTKEVKRFLLIFLERTGHLGGWVVLAKKLRSLGIIPFSEDKELGSSIEVKCTPKEGIVVGSFVEVVRKDLRVVGDVVRFRLGCFNFLFSCGGKLHLGFLWILRAAAAASLMVRRTRKKWRVVHEPVRE